jgi:NADH-quinone oxidoreductase subunit M
MPVYGIFFLFFSIANIGLPGTSSFIGEFMILVGVFEVNTFAAAFSAVGIVLGGAYSLYLANRILFGNINLNAVGVSVDTSEREIASLFPLFFIVLVMGLYPNIFLDAMHVSCSNFVENLRTAFCLI